MADFIFSICCPLLTRQNLLELFQTFYRINNMNNVMEHVITLLYQDLFIHEIIWKISSRFFFLRDISNMARL